MRIFPCSSSNLEWWETIPLDLVTTFPGVSDTINYFSIILYFVGLRISNYLDSTGIDSINDGHVKKKKKCPTEVLPESQTLRTGTSLTSSSAAAFEQVAFHEGCGPVACRVLHTPTSLKPLGSRIRATERLTAQRGEQASGCDVTRRAVPLSQARVLPPQRIRPTPGCFWRRLWLHSAPLG